MNDTLFEKTKTKPSTILYFLYFWAEDFAIRGFRIKGISYLENYRFCLN